MTFIFQIADPVVYNLIPQDAPNHALYQFAAGVWAFLPTWTTAMELPKVS